MEVGVTTAGRAARKQTGADPDPRCKVAAAVWLDSVLGWSRAALHRKYRPLVERRPGEPMQAANPGGHIDTTDAARERGEYTDKRFLFSSKTPDREKERIAAAAQDAFSRGLAEFRAFLADLSHVIDKSVWFETP